MQANGHWKEMLLSQVAELCSAVRVEREFAGCVLCSRWWLRYAAESGEISPHEATRAASVSSSLRR